MASTSSSSLRLPSGEIRTPAFLPDATHGVVRALGAEDLEACGVEALVMSTYHLMQRPGSSTVKALGGLHRMTGWRGPIVTDSGGFQAYSLAKQRTFTSKGITFHPEGAPRPFQLTAEKTVQLQLGYGADIVICLDDCRHVDEGEAEQAESVKRTIEWARRGKREFERLVGERRQSRAPAGGQGAEGRAGEGRATRPVLFAVVQGGGSRELRRRCAEALLEVGFDGYGFGGWPLDAEGKPLLDILAYTRSLIPREIPMHALGVGHPASVRACAAMGYDLFDSALPTRDARRGRLLVPPADYLYVGDAKHTKAPGPIFEGCECPTCSRYSLGYLHHLHEIGDALFARLASLHNLRFMTRVMNEIRSGDGRAGRDGA